MIIELREAEEQRNKLVDVMVGNQVRIREYESISAVGIVSSIDVERKQIKIKDFTIIDSCEHGTPTFHSEDAEELFFNFDDLYSIEVATFDAHTPVALIHTALSQNYCGTEKLVMSPLFYNWYMNFVKDESYRNTYFGNPIIRDKSIEGLHVHAVPNERTIQYNKNNKRGTRTYHL